MTSRVVRSAFYILGALMLGYILAKADIQKMYLHLKAVPLKTLGLVLFLQCTTMILINFQWKTLVGRIGGNISFWDIVLVNAKGNIVDGLTPGVKLGGEIGRILELSHRGPMAMGHATMVVGIQKTFSLLGFLLLILTSFPYFSFRYGAREDKMYPLALGLGIFVLLFFALVSLSFKPQILGRFFGRSRVLSRIISGLSRYSETLRQLLKDPGLFIPQVFLGTFIWVLYPIKLQLVIKSLKGEIGYLTATAITLVAYVMGMFPFLPGGIGSFEASMVLLLRIVGTPLEVGASVALIFRFVTFWFEFIISGILLMVEKGLEFKRGVKNERAKS